MGKDEKGARVHAPTQTQQPGEHWSVGQGTQGEGDTMGKAKRQNKERRNEEAGELTLRDAEVATALNLTAVIER